MVEKYCWCLFPVLAYIYSSCSPKDFLFICYLYFLFPHTLFYYYLCVCVGGDLADFPLQLYRDIIGSTLY